MPTVNSVTYNKPVLPRVSDTSDLASNRASVYSGKALSFDGINDSVDIDNSFFNENVHTVCGYIKKDGTGTYRTVFGVDKTYAVPQAGLYIQTPNLSTTFYANYFSETSSRIVNFTTNLVVGVWYHFAVTFDNGDIKAYWNGELSDSGTLSGTWTKTGDIFVGAGWFNNVKVDFWDGDISNIKTFNVALTSDQVAELYNNPEQILPTGVAAVNLKLWLPMMEGAGSYVYNGAAGSLGEELVSNGTVDEVCQKWAFTDNGYLAATGGKLVWNAPNGSGSNAVQYIDIEAGKTYRVTLDYSVNRDGFGIQLGNVYSTPTLTGTGTYTVDLTPTATNDGYFLLNMSAGTGDLTGYMDNISVKEVVPSNTGTINGATWVAGVGEPVAQTALIDWNKATNNVAYSNAFTSTGWQSNFSSGNKVFGFRNPFGAPTAWKISIPSGASYYLYRTLSGFSAGSVTMSGWFRADQQVVIGFNDGNAYPNNITVGNEWERKSFTFTYGGAGIGIQMDNYFGVSPVSAAKEFYVYGLQATQGATVQPYIETEATAQASPVLLPEGLTASKDILGNDIAKPRSAGSFNFDGISWVTLKDNSSVTISGDLTLEGWVNPNFESLGYWETLFSKTSQSTFQLLINASGILSHYDVSQGDITLSTTVFNDNEWNHFAVVQSGSSLLGYVNGVLEITRSSRTLTMSSAGDLTIGKITGASDYHNGQISNPRIYNYALTAEQVADNFNQKASTFGKSSVTSELQAYINRTVAAGATVEAHSALLNTLTELENK